ncbi:MAG: sulfite exporter TauE/SafE family protein [Leptolyngbyaceae cyanobacterium bins.59]|nr:sulfite exporter TauE/SafE family protein [Leptolyngbyaceae cyanobacterium bins.59]
MNYALLSCLSFGVGILVGLTGIGGASLITPMLIMVFKVPVAIAVSSDVVAATLMKVVGGVKHWRQKTLDLQVVKWLALGSVPGALSGVGVFQVMRGSWSEEWNSLLLHLLGGMILLVTIVGLMQLILSTFFPQVQLPLLPHFDLNTWAGRGATLAIGSSLGFLVGLTSVSSGSMFALVLMAFFQLDTRKLVGTDISQAAILLSFTSLGHLSLGTVDWGVVTAIWLGSVPGVLVGAKLCQWMPQRPLKALLYSILMIVSWKLVL